MEAIKTAHTVHIIADAPIGSWDVWYICGGAWKLAYQGINKREAWETAKLATRARISYKPSWSAPGRVLQEGA